MFAEGSFDLPNTSFMLRLKQAVIEEDFQQIKKEILKTLKDEKDDFCGNNYCTLTDAKNKLYSMLTEILVQEAGSVIDYDIRMINHERDEIKKQMSQIEYNTNRANAKKASRDTLVKEFEIAKKELVESAQDERKQESTGDQNRDKVKSDTATWILLHLDKDQLPTPRAGNWGDQEEPVIYENELQALTKETRDKLQTLTKIEDTIDKAEEEENRSGKTWIILSLKEKRFMDH